MADDRLFDEAVEVGDAVRGASTMYRLGMGPLPPEYAARYHGGLADKSQFPQLMLDYYALAELLLRERADAEGIPAHELLRRIAGE